MGCKSLIQSLALLCVVTGGRAQPQCAFSIPSVLKSGEMARGCLDVKRQLGSVDVNIILEFNGMNLTVMSEQLPVENTLKCPEFLVPNVTAAVPVFLTVSAVATDFLYTDRRALVVVPTGKATVIWLERSIYKPKQTVRGYVIAMDNDLYMTDDEYPAIYVTDPRGNRIFQWMNQRTVNGFYSFSFEILEEPLLGSYTITVEQKTLSQITKTFLVDEYVLTNMGVELIVPDFINVFEEALSYKVIAKYTYGQGVLGKVTGKLCRPQSYGPYRKTCNGNPDLCIPITGQLDSDGSFSGDLELASLQFELLTSLAQLDFTVTVIVEGSGIQVTESKSIRLTQQSPWVYFNRPNMQPYYKKGLGFYIEAVLKDDLGRPMSDQVLELQVNGNTIQNVTTGADGKARDYIDTSEFQESTVNIQVIYKYVDGCSNVFYGRSSASMDNFSVNRFYSRTLSFVHIEGPKEELQCGQTYDFTTKYIFSQSGLEEGETDIDFIYMTMSRAKIVEFGKIPVDLTTSLNGEFKIQVKISQHYAPVLDVIVYHMLTEEVIMDAIRLNTEKCFRNQVSLKFSEESGKPGATVNLDITADSSSLCALRVYDSSLLLLHNEEPLTPAMVFSSLQYNSLNGYNIQGYNVAPPDTPCVDNKQIFLHGFYYSLIDYPQEADVVQVLSDIGLNLYTNMTLGKPKLCSYNNYNNYLYTEVYHSSRPDTTVADNGVSNTGVIESLRTLFPEIWFSGLTNVPDSGLFSLPLQVPGTMTQWRSDMVCLSYKSGFGMIKHPANFTAYQEFFVDMYPAYSIVRGEIMILRVTVANYLEKCVKVNTTIVSSPDYTVEAVDKESIKCICLKERASYSFKIDAKSLGVVEITVTSETIHIGNTCDGPADPNQLPRKDTIVQSFIVEPEGIRNEVTKSMYICVNDTESKTDINITIPENAVTNSTKAKMTVIGDILGLALTKPESLIREPTGCGEQTLSTMMMLVAVVDHLNKTGRLSEETKAKAVQLIGNGYRNLLRFRNNDGSFSAFNGGFSSSWLTIFAILTLQSIRPWTYVEESGLNQIVLYIEGLYDRSSGAYKPRGTVFNNALKGGAKDEVTFTALVSIVFLQGRYAASPAVLRDALNFLDGASREEQSVYTTAMMFYAFRMAENEERSNAMLEKLKEQQIEEGNTIRWERLNKPKNKESYTLSSPAGSAEIEITSYVLCGLNVRPPSSPEDRVYRSKIAHWLCQKQNAQGSYSTTSDTVVALQALTGYNAWMQQRDAKNVVQIKHADKVIREFQLGVGSRDLPQSLVLSYIPGNYNIAVTGNGCVLVQTTVEFHIPVREEDSAFRVSVYTPPENCVDGVAYTIPVHMNVSYQGFRNESNMVLAEVKLPSGYKLQQKSLEELRGWLAKVELKNNVVIIYIEKISRKEVVSISLTLEMYTRVLNFRQQSVLFWDYYEKAENGRGVLIHPCAQR